MHKKEFVTAMADRMGCSASEAALAYNAFVSVLTDGLLDGDEPMYIPGVGVLRKVTVPERTCRNPSTGNSMTVPAHVTVRFKLSSALKEALK